MFIEYARLSDDDGVQAMVEKWDACSPSDRRALSISDVCAAVGLPFSKLLGEVTAAAFEHNTDVSKLVAAVNQPRVVKATVESAVTLLGREGMKDRQMLHLHSNFLPVPRGATTVFRLQQQINNTCEAAGEEPTSLPSFEEDVVLISAAQRGKLFPPAVDADNQAEQLPGQFQPETSAGIDGEQGKAWGGR
jgi:hypothetical protein